MGLSPSPRGPPDSKQRGGPWRCVRRTPERTCDSFNRLLLGLPESYSSHVLDCGFVRESCLPVPHPACERARSLTRPSGQLSLGSWDFCQVLWRYAPVCIFFFLIYIFSLFKSSISEERECLLPEQWKKRHVQCTLF